MQQTTSRIAMVRPATFGYNIETAADNYYQSAEETDPLIIQQKAVTEFDQAVEILRSKDIEVLVLQDQPAPPKPDAVFPNNWFSCREGVIEIFPMHAASRRIEKNPEMVSRLKDFTGAATVTDWSEYEASGKFLEGTGSMIFDHVNKTVYASVSERTNQELLKMYSDTNNLKLIQFNASDENGKAIYHTNVMLSIGNNFAVICDEAIRNRSERTAVIDELQRSAHQVISISLEQVKQFCGNILELQAKSEKKYIVMSESAFNGFEVAEKEILEQFGEIISIPIPTIERIGGGSIRCMIAELF